MVHPSGTHLEPLPSVRCCTDKDRIIQVLMWGEKQNLMGVQRKKSVSSNYRNRLGKVAFESDLE